MNILLNWIQPISTYWMDFSIEFAFCIFIFCIYGIEFCCWLDKYLILLLNWICVKKSIVFWISILILNLYFDFKSLFWFWMSIFILNLYFYFHFDFLLNITGSAKLQVCAFSFGINLLLCLPKLLLCLPKEPLAMCC